MNITNFILFSNYFQKILTNIWLTIVIIYKAIKLLLTLKIHLHVDSLRITDRFILKNGFLLIKWKCRNCLYVRVNRRISTSNNLQITIPSLGCDVVECTFYGLLQKKKAQIPILVNNEIITNPFSDIHLEHDLSPRVTYISSIGSIVNLDFRLNESHFHLKLPNAIKTKNTQLNFNIPQPNQTKKNEA